MIADVDAWKSCDKIAMEKIDTELSCEIGYIGGGNAVVLFNPAKVSDEQIDNVIKLFTSNLLVKAPGLKTGVAKRRVSFR